MADNQGDQVPPPPTSNTTSSGKYTLEKVKEAEKYSGSAIERPRKFFQKYELAAQADGWNEETKAAKLPIFLTGEALIFYRSETTQEEKANYATVRRKIEDKFNRPDLNRVRVNLFNALKKNTAETVEEWAGRVRESAEEAFEDANLATDMAVATFCKELPDEQLRNHLVMKDPPVATLNEALAIARRFKELCRRDVETLNVAAAKLSFNDTVNERDENNDDSFRRIRSASRERYDREYQKKSDNRRPGEYRQERPDYRDRSPDNNKGYRDRDRSRRSDWQDYRSRGESRSGDRGGNYVRDRGSDYRDRNSSRDRRDNRDNRDRRNNYTRSDSRENRREYRDRNDSRDRRENRDYNDRDRRQRSESGDRDNRNFRNNRDAKDQTRCYACNNYGHISYDCPSKRDKGGPAVGSCRVNVESATIRDPYEDINNELRRLEGQPHCGAFHVTKRCKIHREPSPENMEDIGYDYDYIVCPSCHVGTGDSFEGSIIHCNSCEAYFCGMFQWEAYATQETAPQVPPPETFPAEEPRTRQSDSTNKRSSEVTKEMSSQVATEYKKPEETTRDEDQHHKKTEKRKAPTKADNASDDAKEADSTSMDFDDQDKNPENLLPKEDDAKEADSTSMDFDDQDSDKEEAPPMLTTTTKPSTEEATEPEDKTFDPAETGEATETEDTGGDPTVPTDTAFLTSWDPDKDRNRNRVRKSLKTLIRSPEYQVDYNETKKLKKRVKKLKQELNATKETVSTLKKEEEEEERE